MVVSIDVVGSVVVDSVVVVFLGLGTGGSEDPPPVPLSAGAVVAVDVVVGHTESILSQFSSIPLPQISDLPGLISTLLSLQSVPLNEISMNVSLSQSVHTRNTLEFVIPLELTKTE